MESKDGEVGIRPDASLQERIGASAAGEPYSRQASLGLLDLGPKCAKPKRRDLERTCRTSRKIAAPGQPEETASDPTGRRHARIVC
jgi:hypothetical protein